MGKSSLSTIEKDAARDISYAHAARSRTGRALIRTLENATGRIQLIRRADGYQKDVDAGTDFWNVMVERYGLSLDIQGEELAAIPKDGPLVLVANHPFIIENAVRSKLALRTTYQNDQEIVQNIIQS